MPSTAHHRNRRAAKACLSCRKRKVRCDYAAKGSPCSNCYQDGFECQAIDRKKRQRIAIDGASPILPSSILDQTRLDATGTSSTGLRVSGSAAVEELSATPEEIERASTRRTSSFSRHRLLHSVPHYAFLMRLSQAQRPDAGSLEDIVLQLASDKNHGSITPISGCGENELQYLKNVGCFDIPPPHVLLALIDAYFTIFHPFFPVVQKSEFLHSVKSVEGWANTSPNAAHHASSTQAASYPSGRHSHSCLLLLQAVLFIAIGVVPSGIVSAAGFSSRKQARHAYYLKARRLYDLDYNEDPIATIQALLLISQYYPSITERKHTWHWIHQAISLAQVSGLHRDPGNVPHRALWARIWWACVVRDRCNGLGTGRPLMINSLDCTTLMLVLEDVKEEGDSEQDLEIKAIFIEFVKLCQIVEGIVTLRYSSSVTDAAPPDQLKVCEDALEHWMRSLPPQAKRQDHLQAVSGNIGVAAMYRAVLHACFNTIRIALYQSLTLWNGAGDWTTTCQQKVEFAALDNTQLFTHLVNLDLVRFCPTIAVTFTLAPLIVHVLGIRSSRSEERLQVHKNRFELCMIFLRQLRDIYWHAIFYCEFFELAASIKDHDLRTQMSEAHDPLASFLTQRISVGDLMVLRHYQNLGRASKVDDLPLPPEASPVYPREWPQTAGPEVHGHSKQREMSSGLNTPNLSSSADLDPVYLRHIEPMNMNDWLAAHSRAGQSIPFA
ncbi:uncharacterized protein A1O5_09288 [Cladophialophora psammophila CBS 110553]|uniref:Zn(2)-C6 fungal-type domain-containing protein n=1 Tax=Cladophialophora psammophila CBS 110553 TaxID=1182543 RepID=W9WQK4_9EURO|nr:uncharacterized protein A1O5_09288 [Cladophialophora psammophila CBS 110553]EXJ67275.1 hypothetical protein A1O5_09288 [Cladophialophora psammophila CBS 110553]